MVQGSDLLHPISSVTEVFFIGHWQGRGGGDDLKKLKSH